MRALILFLILFGISSAFIFGYRYITKHDVKVAGKLTLAGLISLVLSAIIYVSEYSS